MRNRALHDALRAFVLEAAAYLTEELERGAEIPFDVLEEPGGGAVLYSYKPLTSEFVAERWAQLRALPSCATAANALGNGAENYLRMQAGQATADEEPALEALLDRLYSDASNFEFPEERFERVYEEVERALYQDTVRMAVAVPVHGLRMARERVDLGDGMFLLAGDKLDAPRGAVWSDPAGHIEPGGEPNVLCVLRRDFSAGDPLPLAEARERFTHLITALRLFKPGGVTLGPLAWTRLDEAPWQPLPLGTGGPSRGGDWLLEEGEEPELAELFELTSAEPPQGRIAWALARFEMGCERAHDTEALSDYLLALESLLDATDEAGRASLTLRLAALCAEDGERRAVQRRVELAFALERWVMGGGGANAYLEAMGPDTPRSLVLDMEQHLRALLRDVLCGYLSPDLKSAADDVLLASSEPIEIRAADLRDQAAAAPPPPPPPPPPEPEPDPEPQRELVPAMAYEPDPLDADPGPEAPPFEYAREPHPLDAERPAPAPQRHAVEAGVTESADWDWDEDPESYSAPI